jgi:hypothetical protein
MQVGEVKAEGWLEWRVLPSGPLSTIERSATMSLMRKLWSDPSFLDAMRKGQASGAVALASEGQAPKPASGTSTTSPAQPGPKPPSGVPASPQEDDAAAETPAAAPKKAAPKNPPLTITITSGATASGTTRIRVNSPVFFKVTVPLPDGSEKDVTGDVAWADHGLSINSKGYTDVQVAPGVLTITATLAAMSATGSITVTVVKLIKVTIMPRDPMLEVDKDEPLEAIGEFSDGMIDGVTGILDWDSRKKTVATVDSLGKCHTIAPGTAIIWARHADTGVDDITELTEHAPGKGPKRLKFHVTPVDPTITDSQPLQFTATGEFDDKKSRNLTNRLRWFTDRPNTLAINETTGLATPALIPDRVRISAVDEATDEYAYSEVTVNVPRLESITIAPRDAHVAMTDMIRRDPSVRLTVMGTFSHGPDRDVTDSVVWNNNGSLVATVAPAPPPNQLVGLSEGTANIVATVPNHPGVTDEIDVTVGPAIVSVIRIDSGDTTLPVNGTHTFVATAIFTNSTSQVLTGKKDVRWSSVIAAVVIVVK